MAAIDNLNAQVSRLQLNQVTIIDLINTLRTNNNDEAIQTAANAIDAVNTALENVVNS